MIFTESLVASLWPTWINTEVEYANNKYGKNNPQRTALNGGLSEGSSSYMDFMNYLGKAAIFTNQDRKSVV